MDQNNDRIWNLIARKFSGDITPEEIAELELLLVKNPKENYAVEILNDLWNSKPPINRQYSENKYKELVLRMQHTGIDEGHFTDNDKITGIDIGTKPQKTKKWIFGIASLLITGVTVFFLLQNDKADKINQALPAKNEVNTKYGSKTQLVLPDGTKVWLNAGSKMTYEKNYGIHSREINLTGEAYFDVVKNAEKPFIIHADKVTIKVLGTAFNIRCYPDEKNTETSLVRGSLEVTVKGSQQKFILKPNEKLIIRNSGILTEKRKRSAVVNTSDELNNNEIELSHISLLPQDSSIVETSWVNNRLVFRSESFDEVALKMERWYNVNIEIEDEKLKSKKFTGVFENETVDQALAAMQLTTSFLYRISNEHIIISK